MKLAVSVVGDIRAQMAAEIEAGERAVSAAMRRAGDGLKVAWRGQITGAGLGQRLANTIRARDFPREPSLNAAALVWSNAPEIVAAHDRGVTIRSPRGLWLAIPTPAAGRGLRGGRITPLEWERRTGLKLRMIYRRNKPGLLVAESRIDSRGRARVSRSRTGRGVATVPIFVLVPQVTLRRRLDLGRDAESWLNRLPDMIVREWRSDDG